MPKRASAAASTSATTGPRVRRSRSKSANEATRALLASLEDLAAKVELAASDHNDSARWALRYLEARRPTSVFAPANLSAADQSKLAHAQADQMVGVIRAVLEDLKLSDADYTLGIDLAINELRASSGQGWEPL